MVGMSSVERLFFGDAVLAAAAEAELSLVQRIHKTTTPFSAGHVSLRAPAACPVFTCASSDSNAFLDISSYAIVFGENCAEYDLIFEEGPPSSTRLQLQHGARGTIELNEVEAEDQSSASQVLEVEIRAYF